MATHDRPSVEFVRQSLRYKDGKLFWLERPLDHFPNLRICRGWNSRFAGKSAGSICFQKGDWVFLVGFQCGTYRRSVLTWVVVNGEWPPLWVDHKDRDTTNDRIDNLRLATTTQNNANSKVRSDSRSGFKGVGWSKQKGKYRSRLQIDGKCIHLGFFDTIEEAVQARREGAKLHFGEFACDGEPPCNPTPRQSHT